MSSIRPDQSQKNISINDIESKSKYQRGESIEEKSFKGKEFERKKTESNRGNPLNNSKIIRFDSVSSNFKSVHRMNSKISLLSKKRTGMKTKVNEFSTKISEMDINVQKLLSNVWEMKTNDRKITALVKQLQESVDKNQITLDTWIQEQENINNKYKEIIENVDAGQKLVIDSNTKTDKIQKDLIKRIEVFTKEYQEGFKRIIKLEIITNHHK